MKFKSRLADFLLRHWPSSSAPGQCSAIVSIWPRRACGKVPAHHWLFKEGVSAMTCEHHPSIDGHPFHVAQAHEVKPDCGMPGTHWDTKANTCVADDDFLAAVEQAFIDEWLHQPVQ